jgi:hypothetical protein
VIIHIAEQKNKISCTLKYTGAFYKMAGGLDVSEAYHTERKYTGY